MNWLVELLLNDSTAHTLLLIGAVITLGVLLGKLRFRGISFGIAGVLFAGIAVAQFRLPVNEPMLEFARDLGLILFVYTIGLQVGPGFFASLRREGLRLNLLALSVVAGGVLIAVGVHLLMKVPIAATVGILTGSVTNTPSLGAAQQALKEAANLSVALKQQAALGYAVTYPFGVIGTILSLVLLRLFFRVRINDEIAAYHRSQTRLFPAPATINLDVSNPQLDGQPLKTIFQVMQTEIVVSRLLHRGQVKTPTGETLLHLGDTLLAVSTPENLRKLRILVGEESATDLRTIPGRLVSSQIVVTHKGATGKSLADLQPRALYGVNVTRVNRAGVEFVPSPSLALQFADKLTVVGEESAIGQVAEKLGNSPRRLDLPDILPIFAGIVLGVILGSLPLRLPGIPVSVKLGLAGGPLIVAIVLSRLGHVGPVKAYISNSANLMLREIGIVLFLAAVGLRAGKEFVPTLIQGHGTNWMLYGALITLAPLLAVGIAARLFFKKNYLELCGLLSGSMTDPPALSFAHESTQSDAPAVTYSTVYPLVTFMRIVSAQLLVIFFAY